MLFRISRCLKSDEALCKLALPAQEELVMRIVTLTLLVTLALAPVMSAQRTQVIAAQPASASASITSAPDPAINAVVSAVMPRVANWGPVKGLPFSATETTVREQTLSDSTVIKSTVEVQLWRDSEGRMRAESTLNSGTTTQGHIVTVWNPAEGKAITWVTGTSAVTFASATHLPESQLNSLISSQASAPSASQSGTRSSARQAGATPVARSAFSSDESASLRTETLSAETIAGLDATGTRTTQVIPAGTVNNDRDFTVVSETWTSSELKTTVRQMSSDPRTGTVTTELSGIDRSEPDSALFKPPAGMQVAETPEPAAAGSGTKR
jgi:hypothetical protein